MLPFLWIGPIQTLVSIYLLWPTLGPSCLGALLILSLLTPIQVYLSKRFAYFRRRIASFTDERVRLLNETIASIRLIKLYGWEYYFQAAMHESRRKETDLINRYVSSCCCCFCRWSFLALLFPWPIALLSSCSPIPNALYTSHLL